MEDDLEMGELSGSDTDTSAQTRPPASPALRGKSIHSWAAAQTSTAAYRSSARAGESSDSDSSDDEEDTSVWRHKRQKVSSAPQPPVYTTGTGLTTMPAPGAFGGRKANNIWGSVIQEQCQDSIAAKLDIFGMDGEINMSSRNEETYNYVLARKIMEKERVMMRQKANEGEEKMLDAELEDYMKGRNSEERLGVDAKRKRPMKERLGPRAVMDTKGWYEITEDESEEKVAEEIAKRLQEPKKDLIKRIVGVLGKKKALELLWETATLEESGGMDTMDGSRRRTPGGVYLNLLKNTPSISKAQVRKIFLDEHQKDYKNKKAAQKRGRHLLAKKMKQVIGTLNLQEHDDVSRETFASDTNEALESLEEAADEVQEEAADEVQEEAAEEVQNEAAEEVQEEAAEIYSSADLEVF